jgi:hypothetical protein
MSLANFRTDAAAALGTVPDVHGYSKRPSTPAEGNAWPLLGPLDRAQGTAFMATWLVRVILPQDEDAASAWLDVHWPLLFYALSPYGFVQRAVPVMLEAAGGNLYALEITMIAEE